MRRIITILLLAILCLPLQGSRRGFPWGRSPPANWGRGESTKGGWTPLKISGTDYSYYEHPKEITWESGDLDISQWNDLMSPAMHLLQGTELQQPHYMSNGVLFTSENTCLMSVAGWGGTIAEYSVFCTFKTTQNTVSGGLINWGTGTIGAHQGTLTNVIRGLAYTSLGKIEVWRDSRKKAECDTKVIGGGTITVNDGNWHTVIHSYSAATGYELWVDGDEITVPAGGNNSQLWSQINILMVGNRDNGGGGLGAENFDLTLDGTMKFGGVLKSVLTEEDRANIFRYGRRIVR